MNRRSFLGTIASALGLATIAVKFSRPEIEALPQSIRPTDGGIVEYLRQWEAAASGQTGILPGSYFDTPEYMEIRNRIMMAHAENIERAFIHGPNA